ncbi:nuclear pore complex protein DDB_G0274915-like [Nylanderia fulva]|uniref:nuclear pore complex protein DDB_G0274915-like n=1 Tax=Nylanderia fulva TaxID=613905 RepID=UPI0010FB02D5|nr:nuclear pore complex protein DDB_G0274915-like [Nylanderia fulva]
MKFTCFITVCACLSSTVSTIDEVTFLNRIKKTARPRDELITKDATARREIIPIPQIYPIFPTLQQKFQPQIRIERPKRNYFHPGPQLQPQKQPQKQSQPQPQQQSQPQQQRQQQPQQQHRYNRDRSKYPLEIPAKRVKTRSIIGTSTVELSDNQLDAIPEAIPDEKPIRIEPVLRVTKKKNVLDSILEILRQLLDPPKNEKGPLVPIKMPGSTRKIYLRLIEPLDSSQVVVRFVTQLPVPVIDVEKQYDPYVPIPSVIDPVGMLMNHAHHSSLHPILSNDALLASSSSNRHQAVHPTSANVSHVKGSQSVVKPVVENLSESPSKVNGNVVPPPIVSNNAESNRNQFPDTQVNVQNHEQQLLSQSAASYYQYQQAAEEEVMNKVKELFHSENTTAIEGGTKNPSLEPWYQLSTHRLPLRQVAPLYPHSVEHQGSSSDTYANTYKPPSEVLPGSNSYSTSYEQYNAANLAPEVYPSSYNVPSSYPTSYKQNEVNSAPSSYSVPYQNPNEFVPSPYSVPYPAPKYNNEAAGSYATSYEKQNDPFGAPSVYSSSYEKPASVPPLSTSYEKPASVPSSSTFYEKQIGVSSNDALRVIDPPPFFTDYRTENRSFRHSAPAVREPRFNDNPIDLSIESPSHVVYGKSKREKSEAGFQKSLEIDDKRWQPVVFAPENSDWQEVYEAALAKAVTTERQLPLEEDRPTRKPSRKSADQARRNSKHRPIARDPRCFSTWGEDVDCELAKSVITSTPRSESTVRIIEKQAQAVKEDSIPIERSTTSATIETSNPSTITVISKSPSSTERPATSVTSPRSPKSTEAAPLLIKINDDSVTTEKQPLLIKALESSFPNIKADKLIATETSVINVTPRSMTSNTTEKSLKSSTTTERSSKNTTRVSLTSNKARKPDLPKRPMVMKKSTVIVKKPEVSSTTKRPVTTQKPKTTTIVSNATKKTTTIVSNATKKTTTVARKSKIPRGTSKAKSSTT